MRAPRPVGLLLLLACGGCTRSSWETTPDPKAGTKIAGGQLILEGPGAARYNGAGAPRVRHSALTGALARRASEIAARHARPSPLLDGRLGRVAAVIATVADPEYNPPGAVTDLAMSHYGVVEPLPGQLVVRTTEPGPGLADRVAGELDRLISRGAYNRLGVGAARRRDGTTTVVIVLSERNLSLEPVPRRVELGAHAPLVGTVAPRFSQPSVLITGADGRVRRPAVDLRGGHFEAELGCGARPGRLQVEVVATGARGPAVLANFPVWCGLSPPTGVRLAEPEEGAVPDAADAARDIYDLISDARRAAGLPPLRWDARLAGVAAAHCLDMAQHGFVGHVSATTGSAIDRVEAAGVPARLVLENVAVAATPEGAHEGLMQSPGHRANILAEGVQRVGIGVVVEPKKGGRAELHVTELFIRPPPQLDARLAHRSLIEALNARRRAAGASRLRSHPELGRVAEAAADRMARGALQRPAAADWMQSRLMPLDLGFSSMRTLLAITDEPDGALDDPVVTGEARAFGVGVAVGAHPSLPGQTLYVVLLLAQ